jgi:hypothetical protein
MAQTIPSPDPLPWSTHRHFDSVEHTMRITSTDWRIHSRSYVDEWVDVRFHRLVPITGVYDPGSRLQYM